MGETSGIGSGINNFLPLLTSNGTPASSSTSSSATGSTSSNSNPNSSLSLTPSAQLLSSLLALQSADPSQFTQVMSQIAKGLQTAGQAAGQSTEGQYLQQLASNFASVASTGDILQLLPQTSTQGYNSSGQSVPSSLGIDPTSSIIPQLLAGMTPSAGQ